MVNPQARKKNPDLPEYWHARAITYEVQGKEKAVLISLPISDYRADQIAQLYHQRWEIELGFRDIKSSMLNNAIRLRSKAVDLIYQEMRGMLLADNVVRREASHAAEAHDQHASEMRFKMAFTYIASNLILMAASKAESKTGMRLKELRSGVCNLFLERKKARPSQPRVVKQSKTRYPLSRDAASLKWAALALACFFYVNFLLID